MDDVNVLHDDPLRAWDQPGGLSIVVQSPLSSRNLVEPANHCPHWRQLFPKAELILVTGLSQRYWIADMSLDILVARSRPNRSRQPSKTWRDRLIRWART